MPVSFVCPQCRATIRSPKPLPAGQRVKCPKCAHAFAVGGNEDRTAQITSALPGPESPFGFDDTRPTRASAILRRPKRSPAALLNMSIFVVLLLMGAAAAGAAVFWGHSRPVVAVKETTKETTPETKSEAAAAGTTRKAEKPAKKEAAEEMLVNKGSGQEDPLAFVPADASMVISMDIGKIAQLRPELIEMLKAAAAKDKDFLTDPKKDVGIEFADFYSQVLIVGHVDWMKAAQAGTGFKPDFITVIVKSKQPFDQRKVMAALPKATPQKVNDRITFAIQHEEFTTAFMPSDNILILTNIDGAKLDAVVGSDGSKVKLPATVQPLLEQARKGTLWALVPFDATIKQLLAVGVQQVGMRVPPPLQPVVKAAAAANGASLWLSLDQTNLKLSLGAACASDADAKLITTTLGGLWNQFKGPFNQLLTARLQGVKLPPELQTLIKNVFDTTKAEPTENVAELSVQFELKALEGLVMIVAKNPMAALAQVQAVLGKAGQPAAFKLLPQEQQLLDLVNKEREAAKLPKLTPNPQLFAAARLHALLMGKVGALDDEIDMKNSAMRVQETGYKPAASVTLMSNSVNPGAVVNVWKSNAAQKEHLLKDTYTEVGIGFAVNAKNQGFCSMIFAAPAK